MDRGSKATLPLTIPRRVFKSSAKDSSRRPLEIEFQSFSETDPFRGPELADDTGPWGRQSAPTAGREAAGEGQAPRLAWILT